MCNTCEIQVNERQYDPTRTLTLRNAFVANMNRRFKRLAQLVTQAVDKEDVFGLGAQFQINQTPGQGAFAFMTTEQKMQAFLDWLRQMEDIVILEVGSQYAQAGTWQQVPWTNVYIAQAFQQGTKRALQEMKRAGLGVVLVDEMGMVYVNPMAAEKLSVLFTRTFNDLKGVTTIMDDQISKILAQGLLEGRGPKELARMINSAIIGGGGDLGIDITTITKTGKQTSYFMPGRRRAEILARTEIIRAHHVATIQSYRDWQIEGVYVLAEWETAGDARVCSECASLEGTLWELDAIESLIPLHPQCRCITIPFVDEFKTK